METLIADKKISNVTGEIVTGKMNAHNTFDAPDTVHTESFDAEITADGLKFNIPACSVLHLTVE